MAVIIQLMIGELELVEAHHLLHPLSTFSWGIWMNMNSERFEGSSQMLPC